ncbi:glycosyltransferase [Pseudoalteromonas xiamenensis]
MKNKVLFLTNVIKPGGGPAGYCHNLKSAIDELDDNQKNMEVEFFGGIEEKRTSSVWDMRSGFHYYLKLGINLITFGLIRELRLKIDYAFGELSKEKKKKITECDIIVFQGYQSAHYLAFAKAQGKKTIYMPHSPTIMADEYASTCKMHGVPIDRILYSKYYRSERFFIDNVERIVFPSENSHDEYSKNFTLSNRDIYYIGSGVKPQNVNKGNYIFPSDSVNVMFAGRYILDKGFDRYNLLADSWPSNNVRFFSAGSGPLKASSNVIDLGWRTDVLSLIKDVDVVVIPNKVAYYDLLPLECIALGKPLVMTEVGGNIDQLKCFPVSFPAGSGENVVDLVEALNSCISKVNESGSTFDINKQVFNKHFTHTAMAYRWLKMLVDFSRG